MDLRCSVIVPSYNRRATLELVLEGLAAQTLTQAAFEVIVVLDGGNDDSPQMLAAWQAAGRIAHLRWIEQPNSGQASARNNGAKAAQSAVLVFLDDDVAPEPELLETHLRHHESGERIAVLGDCLVVREQSESLYHLAVWAWWEEMYQNRAHPEHRAGYRDFCAGNFSLRRDDFLAVGGFHSEFRGYGGEDYELGHRLLQSGVRFIADREARACHYHRTTVPGVLRATRQEAHGDLLFGRQYPALLPGLRLMQIPHGRYKLLVALAIFAPALGDLLVQVVMRILPLFERLKLRHLWQGLFNHIRGYAYWRGVREATGSWKALRRIQHDAPAWPRQRLEIGTGLPAELPITVDGPSVVEVYFEGERLGNVLLGRAIEAPLRTYIAEQVYEQLGATLWERLRRRPGLADTLTWLPHPPQEAGR